MTHKDAVETTAVERYLLGEMSDTDRLTFEEHYFSCAECAEELRSAASMLEGARSGLAETSRGNVRAFESAPAKRQTMAWYRSAALPWAVAATLAVAVGYQSLRPWSGGRVNVYALSPVTLRPQSRGVEPTVQLGPGAGPVTLAIEVNDGREGSQELYELTQAGGERVVSGSAPAPAPGSPLLLLIPAWTLAAPMHYILSVHDADGRLLGEYRFEAVR
jgi:hypothetical protein